MAKLLKQVILIRRDLRLKRAELAALASKASTKFLLDNDISDRGDVLKVELTKQEAEWLSGSATRIILGVPSESSLKDVMLRAELLGLACYSVSESKPEEDDSENFEEMLCAAIGPDESERIDEITGNLKLI